MIYTISGTVKSITNSALALEVGPIALSVQVVQPQTYAIGTYISLYIYWHWNTETGPALFGFSTELDKSVFAAIMSCSGLGPKVGLAALEHLGAATFIQAVQSSNLTCLSSVTGIGAKKAEQIVLQLRNKIKQFSVAMSDSGSLSTHITQLHDVLRSLHYSRIEVNNALSYLQKEYGAQQLPFEQLVRHALSFLSKQP